MIEIIPAIIAQDFQDLKEKIKKVEPFVNWAQLDIMDGQFVENSTWNNPLELKNLETSLNLEAHLMVKEPDIDQWINSGVKRIIIHYEAVEKAGEIISKIKENNLEAGLAINPETDIKTVDDFINQLDLILVMTVNPGKGGQKFLEETLVKIKDLREKYRNVNIGVDGGINLETAPKVIKAGANFLAIGSSIFKGNIEENIKSFKSIK